MQRNIAIAATLDSEPRRSLSNSPLGAHATIAGRASADAVRARRKANPKADTGYSVVVYDRKGGKAIARKADAPGKRPASAGARKWDTNQVA